ncbi:MAG: hypothetical protein R3E66_04415 [bacterium]
MEAIITRLKDVLSADEDTDSERILVFQRLWRLVAQHPHSLFRHDVRQFTVEMASHP